MCFKLRNLVYFSYILFQLIFCCISSNKARNASSSMILLSPSVFTFYVRLYYDLKEQICWSTNSGENDWVSCSPWNLHKFADYKKSIIGGYFVCGLLQDDDYANA